MLVANIAAIGLGVDTVVSTKGWQKPTQSSPENNIEIPPLFGEIEVGYGMHR